MPPDGASGAEITFTHEFKRNVRRLAKKYPGIRSDVTPVIDQLEQGETPGDQVQRTGYTIFKVRVRNSDARRGKSGGYRMLYYVRTRERIVLVTIYFKSDQGDISVDDIRRIISRRDG